MLCQQLNLLILSCGHSLLESCPNSFLQCLVAKVAAARPIPVEAHVFGGGHKGLHYLFLRAHTVRIEHSPFVPYQKVLGESQPLSHHNLHMNTCTRNPMPFLNCRPLPQELQATSTELFQFCQGVFKSCSFTIQSSLLAILWKVSIGLQLWN